MDKKVLASTLKKNAMLVVLVLVYLFFMVLTKGGIFRPTSFNALISQNAYVYILGCGMLMCMLTGGNIDLSCGAFVCLLGAVGGVLMVIQGWGTGISLLVVLLIGIAYGCGLGALVAYVHVPPWIATLTGYLAFRGLGTSILRTNSPTGSIGPFPDSFLSIFSRTVFKTPEGVLNWPCMITGIVAAVLVVVLVFRTRAVRLRKKYEADSIGAAAAKSGIGAAVILLVMYTIELVILVSLLIFGVISLSGLTKMSVLATTEPCEILTAPNSIIFSYLALNPVVSKSNTT